MKLPVSREAAMVAAALVAIAAVMLLIKKKGLAQDVGAAVVNAAGDTAAGVVMGIGDQVGIPRTDETECERALREGRTWDASFACPAGTFLKSLF